MPLLNHPILVISYNDDARSALTTSLQNLDVAAAPCATFCEAENLALEDYFCGLVVDLTSIIKAKGEEKAVATSLANLFPTLRVKTLGAMMVPMTMPGEAKQDSSLNDFLKKTCLAFPPRRLRSYRRHNLCLSTTSHHAGSAERSIVLNLSWGGAFLVNMQPENHATGEEIILTFNETGIEVPAAIVWIQPWGGRRTPGFGISFQQNDATLERFIGSILSNDRIYDRDRLIA